MFYPKIRTKNYSAIPLKSKVNGLAPQDMRSIVRLGSTTDTKVIFPKTFGKKQIVEINTVEAIENSRSKIKMKQAFDQAGISHANWQTLETKVDFENLNFPLVLKRVFGYKGRGMFLVESEEQLEDKFKTINTHEYIIENFHNYNREYRLHCTKDGCFYACRKMLKNNADARWYRNDSNCIWILEDNPVFDKPINWDIIVQDCIKALVATKLSIGAFDIRVQSSKNREGKIITDPKFIIIEVNSAPSLLKIGLEKYKEAINKLISDKINDLL